MKKKLTDNQKRLLADLPDDQYKFPGSLEAQSYRKLESMGYAESELMMSNRNAVKGITDFRPAYKRTLEGKKAASN